MTSVRLYVFDCGVLVRGEPTAYGLAKEQVGDTNFADACYLVAHPKGTLLWGQRVATGVTRSDLWPCFAVRLKGVVVRL